jgi:hypothetical protein
MRLALTIFSHALRFAATKMRAAAFFCAAMSSSTLFSTEFLCTLCIDDDLAAASRMKPG